MATGYTKLAQFMVDQQYTILRKFQHLAVRDLLYLQAELIELDIEHEKLASTDRQCSDERQHYDLEWWYLSNSEARGHGGAQWSSALKIREKLREYYESLSQYNHIAALSRPRKSELELLRSWIVSPYLGGGCGFWGKDLGVYGQLSTYEDVYQDDLMLLAVSRGEDDGFTRLLSGPVLRVFHHFWKYCKKPAPLDPQSPAQPDNQSGLHHYSNDHVLRAINVLGTVASSFTPMMSIIALSFVNSMSLRIGLVCLFTMMFSASLAIATKARRIEIFTASAGFASVQVVFVGSTSGFNT